MDNNSNSKTKDEESKTTLSVRPGVPVEALAYSYKRPGAVARLIAEYWLCYVESKDVNHDVLHDYAHNMLNLWANYVKIRDLLRERHCGNNMALALKKIKFFCDRLTPSVLEEIGPWSGSSTNLEYFKMRLLHDIESNPGPVDGSDRRLEIMDNMYSSFVRALQGSQERNFPSALFPVVDLFQETKPQCFDILGLKSFGEVLKECTDRLATSAERCVNTTTQSTSNIVESVMSSLQGIVDSFKDSVKGAFAFIVVFATIHYLEDGYNPQVIRVAKMLLAGSAIIYLYNSPVKDMIVSWITTITPQALTGSWTELVVEGLSLLTFGRTISFDSTFTRICEDFAGIERKVEGLTKIVSRVLDWISKLLTKIFEVIGWDLSKYFVTADSQLNKVFREVSQLTMELAENPMPSADFMRRLKAVNMRLIDLNTEVDKKDTPSRIMYQKLFDTVKQMLITLNDGTFNVSSRDEPLLFFLAGAPGSGKTYVQSFIAQHLIISKGSSVAEIEELRKTWESQVYVMEVDPKHYDTYGGQYVVYYPDAFTMKDVAANSPTEPGMLIYMAGFNPMTLPAAQIEKKGRLMFCSSVIMANTNVTHIGLNFFPSIRNPDAVKRRLNECAWYVYVNPDYALRDAAGNFVVDPNTNRVAGYENDTYLYARVDRKRVPEGQDRLIPDLYYFRRFDFGTGTFVDPNIYSLDHVKDIALTELRSKENMGVQRRKLLEVGAKECAERRARELVEPVAQAEAVPLGVDTTFEEKQEARLKKIEEQVKDDLKRTASRQTRRDPQPRFVPKREPLHRRRNKYGTAIPQTSDEEEFFTAPEYEEIDPNFMERLRGKAAFFRNLSESYTEEIHSAVRELAVHAGKGCNQTTVHIDAGGAPCNMNYEVVEIPELNMEQLTQFLRMCAADHRTVVLVSRLRASDLYNLCKLEYEVAKSKMLEYYFYAQYRNIHVAKIMMHLWEMCVIITPWYEWVMAKITNCYDLFTAALGDYYPTFKLYVSLIAEFALGSAIATGLLWLLGKPTGHKFIDKRSSSQVNWNPEYVARLHDVGYYMYQDYTCYEDYQTALAKEHVSIQEIEGDRVAVIPRYVATPQSNTTPDAPVDVHKVVENTYSLYFQKRKIESSEIVSRRNLCNVFFIANRLGVVVNHARQAIEGIAAKNDDPSVRYEIVLVPFGSAIDPMKSPYTFDIKDMHFIDDADLMEVDLQVFTIDKMRMHTNMLNRFAPKTVVDYMSTMKNIEGLFITKPTLDTLPYTAPLKRSVWMNFTGAEVVYNATFYERGVQYDTRNTYKYEGITLSGKGFSLGTVAGDCVSPCLVVDPRKNNCVRPPWEYKSAGQYIIMYLHTALQGVYPVGVPVYREMFEKWVQYEINRTHANVKDVVENITEEVEFVDGLVTKHFGTVAQAGTMTLDPADENRIMVDEGHHSTAKVTVQFGTHSECAIKRSKFYYKFPGVKAPAHLRDYINKETGEKVPVWENARKGYGSNNTAVPEVIASAVRDAVVKRIFEISNPEKNPEVLSLDQCIYGDPGHVLKGLNFKSSSGAVLRAVLGAHNIPAMGRQWMANPDGTLKPNVRNFLLEYVDHCEQKLLSGTPLHAISMDNLKDELLLKEKVKIGKSRLFCAMDLIHLILCRKWYGAFAGWVAKSKIRNGCAIGVNAYGRDWEAIYDMFKGYGLTFGDYSGYDKKQCAAFDPTLQLIHQFYGDVIGSDSWKIRELLYQDITNSVHLTHVNGVWYLYEWYGGNTSGNFLTAIKNSFSNPCIIVYALVCAMLEKKGLNPYNAGPGDLNLPMIMDNFMIIAMGDDVIAGFKGPLREYATFEQLQKNIKLYVGMDFTDELKGKGGVIPPFREIDEGSFIARQFVLGTYKGMRWVYAPLRDYSIFEGLRWIKGCSDPSIETSKVELAFLELSNYPREVFEEAVSRYAPACVEAYGLYPQYTSYDVAREKLMSISSDRYSFETFDMESHNMLSDLFKQNLITRGMSPAGTDEVLEVMLEFEER